MEGCQDKEPSDPSMMVHFRKRNNEEMLSEINKRIQEKLRKKTKDRAKDSEEDITNQGKLLIDANCAPSDLRSASLANGDTGM